MQFHGIHRSVVAHVRHFHYHCGMSPMQATTKGALSQSGMYGLLRRIGEDARRSVAHNSSRHFGGTANSSLPSAPPKSKDRGPPSKESTQTDFNALDIFSTMPAPSTAVDSCMTDGFALNSGLRIVGAGVLLVAGEAFSWRPWHLSKITKPFNHHSRVESSPANPNIQLSIDQNAFGALDVLWPKPDLLIIGTGPTTLPLSAETRKHINKLGMRIEVQDTRNAAAQYNMLATERGLQQVAAVLLPMNF